MGVNRFVRNVMMLCWRRRTERLFIAARNYHIYQRNRRPKRPCAKLCGDAISPLCVRVKNPFEVRRIFFRRRCETGRRRSTFLHFHRPIFAKLLYTQRSTNLWLPICVNVFDFNALKMRINYVNVDEKHRTCKCAKERTSCVTWHVLTSHRVFKLYFAPRTENVWYAQNTGKLIRCALGFLCMCDEKAGFQRRVAQPKYNSLTRK